MSAKKWESFPYTKEKITGAEALPGMIANFALVQTLPGGLPLASFVIKDDGIAPDRSFFMVDTESSATTDDLKTISPDLLLEGSEIRLMSVDVSRKILVRHNPTLLNGISLYGGTDRYLNPESYLTLKESNEKWVEIISNDIAPLSRKQLTASGTETFIKSGWYLVGCWGGGGAGGRAYVSGAYTVSAGPGGSSGGYAEDLLYFEKGQSVTYTIGAPGLGNALGSGTAGGKTIFSTVIANGGYATSNDQDALSAPQRAPSGGIMGTSGQIYQPPNAVVGGAGASSPFGVGGTGAGYALPGTSYGGVGGNATGNAAGGGGATASSSGVARYFKGGDGSPGIIILTYLGGGQA